MHPSFGDWYRLVELEPRGDTLEARWKGVATVAKTDDENTVLDLVRLALGRAPRRAGFLPEFQEAFRASDAAFPMSGNALELNVLSGSAWAHVLERADSLSDLAALAMYSATFQPGPLERLQEQFRALARNYVISRGSAIRRGEPWTSPKVSKVKIDQVVEPFTQALRGNQFANAATTFPPVVERIEDAIKEAVNVVRAAAVHLEGSLAIQREQSEIAWWILGEYSRDLDVHVSQLSVAAACLTIGKELADLTNKLPGPVSARAILDRMLRNAKQKQTGKVGIDEVVNASDRARRAAWTADLRTSSVEDLVPLHFGVFKSLETDGDDDWMPAFRKATGLTTKMGWSAVDLAEQFYAERLVVRAAIEGEE